MILTNLEFFNFCQENKVLAGKFETQISKRIIFFGNSKFVAFFPKKLIEFFCYFLSFKINISLFKNEKTKVL
jgi:hypothetical protein